MRPMRFRYRLAALILAAVLLAGALLSALTSLAVLIGLRDSLAGHGDPAAVAAARALVRDMLLWAFVVWTPLGGLLAWRAARRLARALEDTRAFAREHVWEAHPPQTSGTPIVEVRRLEDALRGYIADLREELAAAVHSREEVLVVLNTVGQGILQLDPDGRLVRLNPAAADLLHLPGEALGQPIASLVRHPALRSALERPLGGAAAEPEELAVEGRHLLVVRQPLSNAHGAPGRIVLVVDLTPLRKLEDVRRDFVANVSHELKTPLTAIRGYVETLQEGELAEETRRQFLAVTLRNAERLQRIVEELLDLSRIESGGWRPQLSAVDVPALAVDVWSEFRRRAQDGGVAFEVEGEGAPPAHADPDALRQILSNLYDNALRYTPRGGRITVRAAGSAPDPRGSAGQVRVEVADTGSGIPRHALTRVFERFYRVDASRSRSEGGTGLGLAIVKHLAESMGGNVVAESTPGTGTTVRLTLPAAQPMPVRAGAASTITRRPE